MRTVIVALLLVSLSTTSALAQTSPAADSNPLLGTWTLDVAKSAIDYAPLPRDEERTYRGRAERRNDLQRRGGPTEREFRTPTELPAAVDGREYPMPGTGTRNGGDAVSWRLVDPRTVVHAVREEAGRRSEPSGALGIERRHGIDDSRRTGTDLDGSPTRGVRVYDRR